MRWWSILEGNSKKTIRSLVSNGYPGPLSKCWGRTLPSYSIWKTIKERSYRGWSTLYKSSSKGIQIKIRKHINRELNLWVFKFTCWSSNQVTICHQLLNNCTICSIPSADTTMSKSAHRVTQINCSKFFSYAFSVIPSDEILFLSFFHLNAM